LSDEVLGVPEPQNVRVRVSALGTMDCVRDRNVRRLSQVAEYQNLDQVASTRSTPFQIREYQGLAYQVVIGRSEVSPKVKPDVNIGEGIISSPCVGTVVCLRPWVERCTELQIVACEFGG
jgi:hypothetical protein